MTGVRPKSRLELVKKWGEYSLAFSLQAGLVQGVTRVVSQLLAIGDSVGRHGRELRPVFHMAGLFGSEVPIWDIDAKIVETDLSVHTVEQDQSLARTLGSLGTGTTTSTSKADGASLRQAAVCYRYSAAFLAHGV